MPVGPGTIADWTPALLTKWLRDILQTQPPDFLPNLKAENITVTTKLTLRDELVVAREPNFKKIGNSGAPAFENSWVNYGSGWQEAGYWRDPLGWVHLRGLTKSGTVGSPMFTLPPGFRPKLSETFIVSSNSATGRVDVQSDGKVIAQSPSSNAYVSLSNVRFRTS